MLFLVFQLGKDRYAVEANRVVEVLPLLAQGLRNAEIAQRLVVTQKTVDHHVSSILRKLEVTNRSQVGAAATRLGVSAEKANTDQTVK